jgi:DNA-binding NarL/FixJ family response regulator
MKVLIVEDDALVALDLADVLVDLGHEVVGPCVSVEAALLTYQTTPIDFGLLDFNLGANTSAAVADTLSDGGTPFAFVTGYRRDALPDRFRGATVLAKPVRPSDLANILHSA